MILEMDGNGLLALVYRPKRRNPREDPMSKGRKWILRERWKIISIQEGIFNSGHSQINDSDSTFKGINSVVGMQIGATPMENSMEVPQKYWKWAKPV